ncbi:MAG: hypothetical protein HUU34_00910 [Saprospiraceae bacterium]|jgi:plasmid stability protein|nr:hypothetical protein [Saprospiraceae bacterium]
MPTLQVRNLPQKLYDKLVAVAKTERRSLSQQTIIMLEEALALEESRQRRAEALERLAGRIYAPGMDPVELVRSDRDR